MSAPAIDDADAGVRGRRRAALELAIAYGLIVATIWTPRPQQAWLWWASVAWIAVSTWWSFPGWAAMGFRRGGFVASLWVVAAAGVFCAAAVVAAVRLHTLHAPRGLAHWLLAFGGYTVWSFVQQYLLQGYFLFRSCDCCRGGSGPRWRRRRSLRWRMCPIRFLFRSRWCGAWWRVLYSCAAATCIR